MTYPDTSLLIGGKWREAADGRTLPVLNPATGREIGRVARAGIADLDDALAAAQRGFDVWRGVSAFERRNIMRLAASLLRDRADEIAAVLTQEQGKPLPHAAGEHDHRRREAAQPAGLLHCSHYRSRHPG